MPSSHFASSVTHPSWSNGNHLIFTSLVLVIEVPLGVALAFAIPRNGAGATLWIVFLALPLVTPWGVIGMMGKIAAHPHVGFLGDFMVQGGGFETGMTQKPNGEPIENEADNGLSNVVGTLAMARTSDPHSATSQFFINVSDNLSLDHRNKTEQGWGYAVFGEVVEGMEVVNKIKNVDTGSSGGHQNVPVTEVVIESLDVSEEE